MLALLVGCSEFNYVRIEDPVRHWLLNNGPYYYADPDTGQSIEATMLTETFFYVIEEREEFTVNGLTHHRVKVYAGAWMTDYTTFRMRGWLTFHESVDGPWLPIFVGWKAEREWTQIYDKPRKKN